MTDARLTPVQLNEMAELREAGWSYSRLAKRYAVSTGAIHYQCLRAGAVSPKSRQQEHRGPMVFVASDGRTQRRFTPAEDAMLLSLREAGVSCNAIAKEMGRAITSVRIRILTLGLRDEAA